MTWRPRSVPAMSSSAAETSAISATLHSLGALIAQNCGPSSHVPAEKVKPRCDSRSCDAARSGIEVSSATATTSANAPPVRPPRRKCGTVLWIVHQPGSSARPALT